MKSLRLLLIAFVCIIMLFGCHTPLPINETESDSPLSSDPEPISPSLSDTLYPFKSACVWLNGGTILAAPDSDTIRYIDLNNQLVKTVTIPAKYLIAEYQFAVTDNRIFVQGGYSENDYPGSLSACKTTDGDWVLVNGSIWDGTGNLIREFLHYTEIPDENHEIIRTLSDGRTVKGWEDTSILTPVWINEDLVALNGHDRLFLYRVSTDKFTLVDDMSEWIQAYGKMGVYFGVQEVVPVNGGCVYFACKNKEKSNTVRSAWFADETGSRALFEEQEFSAIFGENGVYAMVDWISDPETGDTVSTHLWYATSESFQLTDAEAFNVPVYFETINDNRIVFSSESDGMHRFLILDTKDASVAWLPIQIQHHSHHQKLRTRIFNGSLQYIYTALVDGEYRNYLYDTATNTTQILSGKPFSSREQVFNKQNTHYIEFYPDTWKAHSIRIRPVE